MEIAAFHPDSFSNSPQIVQVLSTSDGSVRAAIDLPPPVQAVAVEGDLLVAKSGTSSALGNSGLRFSVFQIRSGKQVGQFDVHENAVMSDAMQILPSEVGRSGRSFDQCRSGL